MPSWLSFGTRDRVVLGLRVGIVIVVGVLVMIVVKDRISLMDYWEGNGKRVTVTNV